MEAQDDMRDTNRLDNLDNDVASHKISGCIALMRVVGLDVEVGRSPDLVDEWRG